MQYQQPLTHLARVFMACLVLTAAPLTGQDAITLEDIWSKFKFQTKGVPGFNFLPDGQRYLLQTKEYKIVAHDIATGKAGETLFDANSVKGVRGFNGTFESYALNENQNALLLSTESEPLYRHSSQANYWVWQKNYNKMIPVDPSGKQRLALVAPDGSKVAFVKDNDLYVRDLQDESLVRVTQDGKLNHIINGMPDWVYEEEFSLSRCFHWSSDSKKLAWLRFDETAVPTMTLQYYNGGLYPENYTYKYPKVGEPNAKVSVYVYDLQKKESKKLKDGSEQDLYFARIQWTRNPDELSITQLNRAQNKLEVFIADVNSGKLRTLLKEENQTYVDVHDHLYFLKDGRNFIWTSERSGFNHIYLYNLDGRVLKQITTGSFDVTAFYGVDEKKSLVYYQAAAESPLRRELYVADYTNKVVAYKKLSSEAGTNGAQFSPGFEYYIHSYSNANQPPMNRILDNSGKEIRVLEDNKKVRDLQSTHNWNKIEFFTFPSGNETLNGWMIKPDRMEAGKKYPVLMYVYGGPGSQTVTDSWGGANFWWFQMLAKQGYIIASVDNRGTGARGEAFKKITQFQLGHFEVEDQIAAAKYLATQNGVDGARIGIFGWSYGGYMSSLCLLKGNDVFKAAIAVAPVTNWKWYDTIYTERYMGTEKDNPDGYKENSPVNFADRLKGNYLLIHGDADDNVHFQNAAEMAAALINANKQYETYTYPNKNHGIYGGNARLHLYTKMTQFLKDKL